MTNEEIRQSWRQELMLKEVILEWFPVLAHRERTAAPSPVAREAWGGSVKIETTTGHTDCWPPPPVITNGGFAQPEPEAQPQQKGAVVGEIRVFTAEVSRMTGPTTTRTEYIRAVSESDHLAKVEQTRDVIKEVLGIEMLEDGENTLEVALIALRQKWNIRDEWEEQAKERVKNLMAKVEQLEKEIERLKSERAVAMECLTRIATPEQIHEATSAILAMRGMKQEEQHG